ncbi:MAG: thioredoxin domain-containing protein [Chloroflexota bacterium]
MVRPIVDGLEEQYQDQVAFVRIDAIAGDGPTIMDVYQISGHPTILLYDEAGNEVNRLFGPQPADVLDGAVQQLLP